jgi:hypothetical protein
MLHPIQPCQAFYQIKASFLHAAFRGDISCDFESPQWDEGFCNWEYDFASNDTLAWDVSPPADLSLKKKWKFGNFSIFFFFHFFSVVVALPTAGLEPLTLE